MLVCSSVEGVYGNSGIGTFCTGLATLLASNKAYSVSILYTRDEVDQQQQQQQQQQPESEQEGQDSFQSWVDYYSNKLNVNLLALQVENAESPLSIGVSPLIKTSYQVYQYLLNHPHDIVHFPDFEGVGYYSLLAKKEGLHFLDTTFVVGLHGVSRWIISENVGHAHLTDTTVLEVDFMEQKSVEMADILWTPSNYMLRWLHDEQPNWNLPSRENTYLLPLVPASDINELLQWKQNQQRIYPQSQYQLQHQQQYVRELVFFGRLETRKGLVLFCDALDEIDEELKERQVTVTFLGKDMNMDDMEMTSLEYIRQRADRWSFKTKFYTSLGRREALKYLMNPQHRRVAVSNNSTYYN